MLRSAFRPIYRFLFIVFFVLSSQLSQSQTVTGPSPVDAGSTQTYEYSDGFIYSTRAWTILGGTKVSEWYTKFPMIYYVTVQWGTGSTGSVTFYGNGSLKGSKFVTINTPGPDTPSAPTASTNNCGSVTLTRGMPPAGVTWYWQSTSTGTSTTNSNTTITLTSGTVYYLRAREDSTGYWSDSSSSVSYTINPLPATPPAPTVTNACGSTLLTRGTPPAGLTWYWQSTSTGTSTAYSGIKMIMTSGTVYYIRALDDTTGCWSNARTINYTVTPLPAAPAAPTVTNNCGSTILTRGIPPAGITWYWQSTSDGTSTTDSNTTKTLTTGTVYYLRAQDNTTSCWSSATSVGYTVNAVPAAPAVPTVTNNCGSTILTRGTPPAGITWYWQSTSGGTSTADSNTTKTLTTGTVYYLRARDNATGCWSSATSVGYTVNAVPGAPSVPTVTNNCGSTVLTKGTSPAGITWYWQSTSGGTSTADSNTTKTLTTGTVYYLRARNNTTGCWSSATSVSYTVNMVPAAPSVPTVTNNCGSTVLTRGTPPAGITWYWQSTSTGTATTDSNTTKTLTTGTVYYLRARNNTTGCWSSATSVSYTINAVPAAPAVPTVTNNCGSTVLTRGTPPAGITWYWQSTSGGTSTADSNTTKTLTTGTVYYLRARNNTTGCWSSATSVSYTVNAVPAAPAVPTVTNNCGSTILTRGTPPAGITWYWQSTSTGTATADSNTTKTLTTGTVYYLRARNNTTGCWSSATSVGYTVNAVPAAPAVPTVTNNCGSTILTRGTPPAGITWYWQSTSTGTATTDSNTTKTLTSGTVYYLGAKNTTTGCWSSAVTINYTVTPPTTWYADTDGDGYGNPNATTSACSQPAGYVGNSSDYDDTTANITNIPPQYFYVDIDGDGFGDPANSVYYSVKPAGYVTNNTDLCPDTYGANNGCDYVTPTLSNENYIYTRGYQRDMVSDTEILENKDVIESVTYFDGLGRPMQGISIKASPDVKDIVTHIGYDPYGRQDKDWLPYMEPNSAVGSYRTTDQEAATNAYYMANYAADMDAINPNAFSQKGFEASTLNRVLEQGAPGKDWLVNQGSDTDHTIKFDYQSNTFDPNNPTDPTKDNVRLFTVSVSFANNTYTPTLQLATGSAGYYAQGVLYKTVTRDENWDPLQANIKDHTTEEFKDKQGRVVLKRTYNSNTPHDTYYVYDDYGNLTYVLPPKMEPSTAAIATITAELNELGYQYTYDHRNRLVEKKIPGKGKEYIIYNKLDQPIMTQDVLQRPNKQWLFTKYDAFGRAVYTGLYVHPTVVDRAVIQAEADGVTDQYEVFNAGTPSTIDSRLVYYTNTTYPNTGISKLFTVTYYDSYIDTSGISVPGIVKGTPTASGIQLKGLATVNKVRVLETNDWITTVTGYDVKGRPIYTESRNDYLLTTDKVESELDFTGKVLSATTTHTKDGVPAIVTTDAFTYDHVGRLKKQEQTLAGHTEVIAQNAYDNLGQLTTKKVGGTEATPLQTVNYAYNVRGWLKQINDPAALGSALFGFKINYNTADHGGMPLFNGNISEAVWKTANTDNSLKWYAYSYDALNRILTATDNSTRFNVSGIAYDKNGNLTSLKREGHLVGNPNWNTATDFGTMDNLTYNYLPSSNKLMSVDDAVTGTSGEGEFKDVTTTGDDYAYDLNGNMISDANKGITSISYNHLNLPKDISINGNGNVGTISYIYDATGIKLEKKVVESGNPNKYTFYAGNYVYERTGDTGNGSLKFFNHPEGYVDVNNGTYSYVYQYKDHLGNIRLSYQDVNQNNTNPVSLQILEENNYYPFGLKHKGYNEVGTAFVNPALDYQYNGKEFEDALGVNLYGMDMRQYDPAIGRWTSNDPITHHSMSTYTAFNNNPMFWADPSGADAKANDWLINIFNASSSGMTWYNTGNGGFSTKKPAKDDGGGCDDCSKCPETCNDSKNGKEKSTDVNQSDYDWGGYGLVTNFVSEFIMPKIKNGFALTVIPVYDETGRVIGLWRTFDKVDFKALKFVTGTLKTFGVALSVINEFNSADEMIHGEKSVGRWAVGLSGTVGSMYAASAYGGPVGVFVGGVFYLGDLFLEANEVSTKQAKSAYETSRFKLGPNPNTNYSIFSKEFWNSLNPGRYLNFSSFYNGFNY